MSHGDLVRRAVRWLVNTHGCSVAFPEFSSAAYENPDAIGFAAGFSTLIECKASRADFLVDKHKPVRRVPRMGIGSQRYYMAPPGIIRAEDLPDKWGLLEVHGRHVKVIRKSGGFADRNHLSEIRFLVSMLRRVQVRIGSMQIGEWLKWGARALPAPCPVNSTESDKFQQLSAKSEGEPLNKQSVENKGETV